MLQLILLIVKVLLRFLLKLDDEGSFAFSEAESMHSAELLQW